MRLQLVEVWQALGSPCMICRFFLLEFGNLGSDFFFNGDQKLGLVKAFAPRGLWDLPEINEGDDD